MSKRHKHNKNIQSISYPQRNLSWIKAKHDSIICLQWWNVFIWNKDFWTTAQICLL